MAAPRTYAKTNIVKLAIKDLNPAEWRTVPSTPAYEVSRDGRVRNKATQKIKVCTPLPKGYLQYGCERRGKHYLHRAVAEAFIGPCPLGMEVNHIDTVKSNCAASNLEYLTHAANIQHAVRVKGPWTKGPSMPGEKNPACKLTDTEVLQVKAATGPQRLIAHQFGVSQALVSMIKNGKVRHAG